MSFARRATGYLLRNGRVLSDAATPSAVRRRQRQRALAVLQQLTFSSVTFVCQGNINRSALAEHRFRALRGEQGPPTRSCGLHLRGGRSSPPLSIDAAAQLGLDLRAHLSRVATELPLSQTLLVGFEPHHLLAWCDSPARESGRVLLGLFADDDGTPLLIPDPYGHELPYVTTVFRRVIECVDGLARRLEPASPTHWRFRA
jgi:protein-tyrosine-phosphatase